MPDLTIKIDKKPNQSPYYFNVTTEKKLKGKTVIIIGAGISGLAAGYEAAKNGATVIILEARNRIGGRIYSSQNKNYTTINMGANWIHSYVFNPVYNISSYLNLKKADTPLLGLRFYNSPTGEKTSQFLTTKNFVGKEDKFIDLKNVKKYVTKLYEIAENYVFNELFWTYVDRSKNHSVWEVIKDSFNKQNFTWYEKQYIKSFMYLSDGSELEEASIFNEDEEELAQTNPLTYNSTHYHIDLGRYDVALEDYSKIPQFYQKSIEQEGGKILFNQYVKNVNYQDPKNTVVTTDEGKKYKADYVISTLPVKVLKSKELFTPDLPNRYLKAASNIHMGKWEKFVLHFDLNKLSEKQGYILATFYENAQYVYHPDHYKNNEPKIASIIKINNKDGKVTFLCVIAANEAKKLASIREEKGVEALKSILIDEFKKVAMDHAEEDTFIDKAIISKTWPDPDSVELTNWVGSPYSQGSWSVLGAYGFSTDRQLFHKNPYGKSLYFAGEHTHLTHPGTTHGGLFSGQDAVLRIVQNVFKVSSMRLWGHDRIYSSSLNITKPTANELSAYGRLVSPDSREKPVKMVGQIVFDQKLTVNTDNIGLFPEIYKSDFKKKHKVEYSFTKGTYYYEIRYTDTPIVSFYSDKEKTKKIFSAHYFSTSDDIHNNAYQIFNKWALPIRYDSKNNIKIHPILSIEQHENMLGYVSYKAKLSLEILPMRALDHKLASK